MDISILSLYTEGDCRRSTGIRLSGISILSLYTEGDENVDVHGGRPLISILSLYTEGDAGNRGAGRRRNQFQSSPSIQRETSRIMQPALARKNFNPLPLYRGRRLSSLCSGSPPEISILSLYTEGDCKVAQYTTFKLSYICAALLNILSAQIIFNRFAIFYK